MFYEHTLSKVREALEVNFPGIQPVDIRDFSLPQAHVLWMVERIENLDTSSQRASAYAARLIGRILQRIERELMLWNYQRSEELLSVDMENKKDIPHKSRSLQLHSR